MCNSFRSTMQTLFSIYINKWWKWKNIDTRKIMEIATESHTYLFYMTREKVWH